MLSVILTLVKNKKGLVNYVLVKKVKTLQNYDDLCIFKKEAVKSR